MSFHDCPCCVCDDDEGYSPEPVDLPCVQDADGACDPWCPAHATCGACGSPVVINDGDPAFCPECNQDVMPAGACQTGGAS